MKQYPKARNIKIRFAGHTVILADASSREKTPDGVEIWTKPIPGGGFKSMASLPSGTLEKFMHCRPEVVDVDWVEV